MKFVVLNGPDPAGSSTRFAADATEIEAPDFDSAARQLEERWEFNDGGLYFLVAMRNDVHVGTDRPYEGRLYRVHARPLLTEVGSLGNG